MPDSRRVPPRVRTFNPAALQQLIDQYDGGIQRKAARRIGISQPTLSKILSGLSNPRSDTIVRACEVYGVSTDWVYSGQQRQADDTFDMGVRHAVQNIRRELERLERDIGSDEQTFIRPAPRDTDMNRVPMIPPEMHRTAEAPAGHVAKKRGRGRPPKKKRA